MILEALSTSLLGGLYLVAHTKQKSSRKMEDHEKIISVADACNLKVHGNSIRLHRKTSEERFVEYVYQIPHGLSFKKFEDHINEFEDGLNIKKRDYVFTKKGIKKLWRYLRDNHYNRVTLKDDLYSMFFEKVESSKNIKMSFDGMLHIKVFDKGLPSHIEFDDQFLSKCTDWRIPLGDNGERMLKWKIGREHMAIAGGTRQGKTQFSKMLITTLIKLYPDEVAFSFIDLKGGVSMNRFKHLKQTSGFADEIQDAVTVLDKIYADMKSMEALCRDKGVETANELGFTKKHFIVIDEAAELSPIIKKNKADELKFRQHCEMRLSEIARLGAGFNYILLFATQYPTADVMNKDIKSNINQIVCFKLRSGRQSQTVLDKWGAEKLENPGRALVIDGVTNHKVQVPLMSNSYIDSVIKPHIIIKPRKDDENAEDNQKGTAGGRYSLLIEETELS
ncbi:FtsK/SpoIIIE domain-containing protein [Bacillus weihaiensis]|uniref:FtsK/SpoIIIE domain-containing protein n=1 Tax=Bacillus weihaiensis TaxID=1547283 RepID=UPI00235508F9|nr:FtsK/SpoIIIE domain-containing protein [Bacillus weihaiensis]